MGDEADPDEILSGSIKSRHVHAKAAHNRRVGVVTETLVVGHGNQKEIESSRPMRAGFNVAVPYQALVHPTELTGYPAQALWRDKMLLNH